MRGTDFTRNVDKVIGSRIALLRQGKGWSRQELASRIGVTHQQLQKYEKGTNRISVGMLLLIADVLSVTVENLCGKITEHTTPLPVNRRLTLELIKNFTKIKSSTIQESVSAMVRTLATQ